MPRLGKRFDQSSFRARFEAKGRYAQYLGSIPTFVITMDHPALLGVFCDIAAKPKLISALFHNPMGNGKAVRSSTPSMVSTFSMPRALSLAITSCTSTSGAEAPAVTPTRFFPSSQEGSISEALSTMRAKVPDFSATSLRRLELETVWAADHDDHVDLQGQRF